MDNLHEILTVAIRASQLNPGKHPGVLARMICDLHNMALDIRAYGVTHCNRDLTETEQKASDALDANARKMCAELNIELEINHDPRGAALRLSFEDGYTYRF